MEEKEELAYKAYLESLSIEELEALNPETDVERLRSLATHGNFKVRANVANNESTPADLFSGFVSDEHYLVRVGLAFNPNVSDNLLEALSKDEDELVRKAASK